jgi:hypothetical protein
MDKQAKERAAKRREWGTIWPIAAASLIGVISFLGVTYTLYISLREHTEQERIARSAGLVALKTYLRLGPEFQPFKRITYALEASGGVLKVNTGRTNRFGQLSEPNETRATFEARTALPTQPVTVTWEDPAEGSSQASASVTLGALDAGTVDCRNPSFQALSASLSTPAADRVDTQSKFGALVTINGLSSTDRRGIAVSSLFGLARLGRSPTKVLMLAEVTNGQITLQECATLPTPTATATPTPRPIVCAPFSGRATGAGNQRGANSPDEDCRNKGGVPDAQWGGSIQSVTSRYCMSPHSTNRNSGQHGDCSNRGGNGKCGCWSCQADGIECY